MNLKNNAWLAAAIMLSACSGAAVPQTNQTAQPAVTTESELPSTVEQAQSTIDADWSTEPHPLQIEVMREQTYTPSPITIEQTLDAGINYNRYVVSYLSEGFKIYALMTVPMGEIPDTGWPVIIFNHGYIHPPEYRTDENYVTYMNMIARSGYIVFKSDLRGHGNSEGEIIGAGYGSPDYTIDVLNAVATLKEYDGADPDRFGMWGHSMGGQVTLRAMVVSKDIKAGVIWAGAIAPYPEIISEWDFNGEGSDRSSLPQREGRENDISLQGWISGFGGWVDEFESTYGTAEQNPDFWRTISPNSYLADLSGPIQLQHSTADWLVPLSWSEDVIKELEKLNIPNEFYIYEDDDHNITGNLRVAMQRTVTFFDQYVKGS